jgi:hypothetical protein
MHDSEQHWKCMYNITLWHILIFLVTIEVSSHFTLIIFGRKQNMNTEHTAMGTE